PGGHGHDLHMDVAKLARFLCDSYIFMEDGVTSNPSSASSTRPSPSVSVEDGVTFTGWLSWSASSSITTSSTTVIPNAGLFPVVREIVPHEEGDEDEDDLLHLMQLTGAERQSLEEQGVPQSQIQRIENLLSQIHTHQEGGTGPEARWALARLIRRMEDGLESVEAAIVIMARWNFFSWVSQFATMTTRIVEHHMATPLRGSETQVDHSLPHRGDVVAAGAEVLGIWRDPPLVDLRADESLFGGASGSGRRFLWSDYFVLVHVCGSDHHGCHDRALSRLHLDDNYDLPWGELCRYVFDHYHDVTGSADTVDVLRRLQDRQRQLRRCMGLVDTAMEECYGKSSTVKLAVDRALCHLAAWDWWNHRQYFSNRCYLGTSMTLNVVCQGWNHKRSRAIDVVHGVHISMHCMGELDERHRGDAGLMNMIVTFTCYRCMKNRLKLTDMFRWVVWALEASVSFVVMKGMKVVNQGKVATVWPGLNAAVVATIGEETSRRKRKIAAMTLDPLKESDPRTFQQIRAAASGEAGSAGEGFSNFMEKVDSVGFANIVCRAGKVFASLVKLTVCPNTKLGPVQDKLVPFNLPACPPLQLRIIQAPLNGNDGFKLQALEEESEETASETFVTNAGTSRGSVVAQVQTQGPKLRPLYDPLE
ncbi:SSB, partial [Symbiodinium sp. CCMP2456]